MIADERAILDSVYRPFEIDQMILMVDLASLLAHIFFANSIIVTIESSVPSLLFLNPLPEIGLFNQFLRADDDLWRFDALSIEAPQNR